MASNQILTTAQAQAVYSAMCALSSAEAHAQSVRIRFPVAPEKEIGVDWNLYGVVVQLFPGAYQHYESPTAFAAAYGLRQPPDAAALLEALQAALAYNDSVMSTDGSGQFSWGPIARAAIAQATA